MMTNGNTTNKKVIFHTLGCKVNSTETEGMRHLFTSAGYVSVSGDQEAEVCVINTCTVTHLGDKKSRQLIRRVHSKNPSAIIAVVGCYAQVDPDAVAAIPGVDIVLGNNRKHTIVEAVEKCLRERRIANNMDVSVGIPFGNGLTPDNHHQTIDVIERAALDAFEEIPLYSFSEHTRAFIKIQDGCDQFCSYCIIPYARGPVRSRHPEEVIAEAERMQNLGFRELVLTGIHLTSYQDEQGSEGLVRLISRINALPNIARIRLGSLEPMFITEPFLAGVSRFDKLCPHFHLSLQSGSERTLKRMNRHYSPKVYEDIVSNIRTYWPDAAITTDIMVGFPGETTADFQESLVFCERIGFAQMHVFAYSPRKGTRAAGYPDQVPENEKDSRSQQMMALSEKMTIAYRSRFLGKSEEVLFELGEPHMQVGHTKTYIPVHVPGDTSLRGNIQHVFLESISGETLIGKLCDNCMTTSGMD